MSLQFESSLGSWPSPKLLTPAERQEYVSLMRLGAPPELACQRAGVGPEDVQATIERDADFAGRLELIEQLLARNVQSAIYKAAMGGSVYAQSNYIRLCRPPQKEQANDESLDSVPSIDELNYMLQKKMDPPEREEMEDGTGI